MNHFPMLVENHGKSMYKHVWRWRFEWENHVFYGGVWRGKKTSISRGGSVMDTSSLNVGIFRQSLGIFMGIWWSSPTRMVTLNQPMIWGYHWYPMTDPYVNGRLMLTYDWGFLLMINVDPWSWHTYGSVMAMQLKNIIAIYIRDVMM